MKYKTIFKEWNSKNSFVTHREEEEILAAQQMEGWSKTISCALELR
jgi:hypothetical protein